MQGKCPIIPAPKSVFDGVNENQALDGQRMWECSKTQHSYPGNFKVPNAAFGAQDSGHARLAWEARQEMLLLGAGGIMCGDKTVKPPVDT